MYRYPQRYGYDEYGLDGWTPEEVDQLVLQEQVKELVRLKEMGYLDEHLLGKGSLDSPKDPVPSVRRYTSQYAFLSFPASMAGGPYPVLAASLLDGTQPPPLPRPLDLGDAWYVYDLQTGDVVHVSYFGEGLEPYCEFASVCHYGEAMVWLEAMPWLRETMYQQIRDPVTALAFAKEDRSLVPRFLPLVKESHHAVEWARVFRQDLPELRKLVRGPADAFAWAWEFPHDRKRMRKFIRDPEWISRWLDHFPDDLKDLQPYLNTLPDSGKSLVDDHFHRRAAVAARHREEYSREYRPRRTRSSDCD